MLVTAGRSYSQCHACQQAPLACSAQFMSCRHRRPTVGPADFAFLLLSFSLCRRSVVDLDLPFSQTTLRKADTNEIVSILGHELGHWKMSHTLQGFVITQSYLLASFCAFGLATELGESLRLSFGYSTSATLITLYLFFAVVSFANSPREMPHRMHWVTHSVSPEGGVRWWDLR